MTRPTVVTTHPIQDPGYITMAAASTPPGGSSGGGRGEISPEEREAFKQRADELGQRLEAAKGHSEASAGAKATAAAENSANASALGRAMRTSTELIGGVVVGSGIGYLLDRWLNTFPAFFIVFFLLGFAAGMLNVMRAASAIKTGPANTAAGPAARDDDDES